MRRMAIAFLVLAFPAAAAAQTPSQSQFEEYQQTIKKAYAAYDTGDCKAAIRLFTRMMKLSEYWPQGSRRSALASTFGRLWRGSCHRKLGNLKAALADLKDGSRASDYFGDAGWLADLELGLLREAMGQPALARQAYDRAIKSQWDAAIVTDGRYYRQSTAPARRIPRHARVGEPHLRRCLLTVGGKLRRKLSPQSWDDCRRGLVLYELRCQLTAKDNKALESCRTKTAGMPDVAAVRRAMCADRDLVAPLDFSPFLMCRKT